MTDPTQTVNTDLKVWAHHRVNNRRRAKRLKVLNAVLLPVCCISSLWVAWEVWRVFR